MISLLFAMDRNRVIGSNNDLPWRLPKDLKFFKELTVTHSVVMGRKTFNSMGRPLPNRENIVLTRDKTFLPSGCRVIHSIETIVQWNKNSREKEWFVIGGAEIFKQILPYADRMYMTYIDEVFEGDTYFPLYNENEWTLTKKENGVKDENNPYDYYFLQYDRKR
ncbi:dihydrofolate reductase [Aquibacillus sp. 3ASR75-11]|uniref:Dihydrofolate reductase n=1 Tax=Terrihalobacillus insolitus TaxID=2950438 RepID=A0A9X3WRJ3_9BACI|nr:dihydrofolate reductase [Terrihalobacillus insolitus]MDC3412984.1 dihydrofolate reductase [Terrihalobacillus insolitus]MDC3424737.1 dihydrofolate reductase [Terrihalobacillus insolitus]